MFFAKKAMKHFADENNHEWDNVRKIARGQCLVTDNEIQEISFEGFEDGKLVYYVTFVNTNPAQYRIGEYLEVEFDLVTYKLCSVWLQI